MKEYGRAVTKDGYTVIIGDYYMEHMEAHPDVKMEDVLEAISRISGYNGEYGMLCADMRRTVGKSNVVETRNNEKRISLLRKGRADTSPFVFGREPEDTPFVNVGICKSDNGKDNEVFTAYCGDPAPKEPKDRSFSDPDKKEEYDRSVEYWDKHAFVYNPETIDFSKLSIEKYKELLQNLDENEKRSTDTEIKKQIGNDEYKKRFVDAWFKGFEDRTECFDSHSCSRYDDGHDR